MIYVLEDQGGRPYMEDKNYIERHFIQDYNLICIFDGHGNDSVAKFLQMYYKDVLRTELATRDITSIDGFGQAIASSFNKMNNSIPREMGYHSGSTALVMLMNAHFLWIGNIGDCRAILCYKEQETKQLTLDHKPYFKIEYDRIIAAGGYITSNAYDVPRLNGTLSLSRSFGDFYLMPVISAVPDVFRYVLDDRTKFIFIASDGIFDVIQNEEINSIMFEEMENSQLLLNDKIRNGCQKILKLARMKGSTDNVTIAFATI